MPEHPCREPPPGARLPVQLRNSAGVLPRRTGSPCSTDAGAARPTGRSLPRRTWARLDGPTVRPQSGQDHGLGRPSCLPLRVPSSDTGYLLPPPLLYRSLSALHLVPGALPAAWVPWRRGHAATTATRRRLTTSRTGAAPSVRRVWTSSFGPEARPWCGFASGAGSRAGAVWHRTRVPRARRRILGRLARASPSWWPRSLWRSWSPLIAFGVKTDDASMRGVPSWRAHFPSRVPGQHGLERP